jgi:hypothetical protein
LELPDRTKTFYYPKATTQQNVTDASVLEIFGESYYATGNEGD